MRHQEGCYAYNIGVTQFGTAHSFPCWGSLHEVLEMQTNKAKHSAVCAALQVAYIQYVGPGLNVSHPNMIKNAGSFECSFGNQL